MRSTGNGKGPARSEECAREVPRGDGRRFRVSPSRYSSGGDPRRGRSSPFAHLAWAVASIAALPLAAAGHASANPHRAAPKLPAHLVYLRDVDATIAQDIKYATTDNFTGARVDGYDAGECILTRQAAEALKKVQADLKGRSLSLKVYDCYRPQRAVRAFMRWARHLGEDRAPSKRFHPRIARDRLVSMGYIAAVSRHSRADTVDVTLIPIASPPAAKLNVSSYSGCTSAADGREPGTSIDMGTGFDCFDIRSHTASGAVTGEQRKARNILLSAMVARGFRNYHREWWHFGYAATIARAYDFPIAQRPAPLER
jgi:D-alanyl-D-alanine dipeptidase